MVGLFEIPMRLYELIVVLKSSLSESQRKKLVDSVKELLKEAKITKHEEWGQKVLSYPIKKETAGVFHFLTVEAENVPKDLERRILATEGVIRHLLIRKK